jgi:opacity protein-like surface antigen
MKKFILIPIFLLTSHAASANQYYFRADAGLAFTGKNASDVIGGKLKQTNSFIGSFGVGTYINDNVRAEFSILMGSEIIQTSSGGTKTTIVGFTDGKEKHKVSRQNFMIKIEPEFLDYGYGKVYASAGVGLARVADNLNITANTMTGVKTYQSKSKYKYNPAMSVGLGTGVFISDNVSIDLSYNYLYSGKTKGTNIDIGGNKIEVSKVNVMSHNITAGIRYSF